jgi:hypothetical protein
MFTCEWKDCCQEFESKLLLLNHVLLDHANNTMECQYANCKKKFAYSGNTKRHLYSHFQITYKCEQCGKKYSTKFYFEKHALSHVKYTMLLGDQVVEKKKDQKRHIKLEFCKPPLVPPIPINFSGNSEWGVDRRGGITLPKIGYIKQLVSKKMVY